MFLGIVFAAFAVSSCRESAPPAVVLVSMDTLRADRLNAYGYERRMVSPHMDAFAREGIQFETAVTASPWTTPSHASLFTGLYPSRHGLMTPWTDLSEQLIERRVVERLPDEHVSLAEALHAAGFATAGFTGGLTLHPSIGFSQGFDRYETDMFKVTPQAMDRMLAWIDEQKGHRFFLFWQSIAGKWNGIQMRL